MANLQRKTPEQLAQDILEQNNEVQQQTVAQPQQVPTQQKVPAKPVQQLAQEHEVSQGQQLEQKYQDRKPITTNQDLIEELGYKKPKTPQEIAADEKRQKRDAIFAAIGDGISALSNLYFANKGAKSSYDPSQSMTAKMQARRDKLEKERELRDREYRAAMLRAKELDATLAERRAARKEQRRYNDERLYLQARAAEEKQKNDQEKLDETKRVNDARIAGKGTFAKTGRSGGRRSSSGSKVTVRETYDNHGRIKNTVVTTKGNTPPSRRTNNTPPSRSASSNTPPSKRKK